MSTVTERIFSDPAAVEARLEAIERELAEKQNAIELAAALWFPKKREREKEHAKIKRASSAKTVDERKDEADERTADMGAEIEGEFEALRLSLKALEARATIGQSILKSQTRAGA